MSKEYDPKTIFYTQTAALAFLHEQGFKISMAKLNSDYKKGLIPCSSNKAFLASDLMEYATVGLKAPTPFQQKKAEKIERIAIEHQELKGLATGIIIDGKVVQAEAEFLLQWLEKHEELAQQVTAVRQLRKRATKMLQDGELDSKEGRDLLDIIHRLILPDTVKPEHAEEEKTVPLPLYNDYEDSPSLSIVIQLDGDIFEESVPDFEEKEDVCVVEKDGLSIIPADQEVFDKPPSIDFSKMFCFTGIFALGERSDCENIAKEKGGIVKRSLPNSFDGYVVVGSIASPHWCFGNYGRKIEDALAKREDSYPVLIIHEDLWADALSNAEKDAAVSPTQLSIF